MLFIPNSETTTKYQILAKSSPPGSLHLWCCFLSQFLGLFVSPLLKFLFWSAYEKRPKLGEISPVAQLSEVTGQTKPLPRMCSWPGSPVPHRLRRRSAVPASLASLTRLTGLRRRSAVPASLTRLTGLRRHSAVPASLTRLTAVFARPSLAGGSAGQTAGSAPARPDHLGYNAFCSLVSPFTTDFKNGWLKESQKPELFSILLFACFWRPINFSLFLSF